MTIRFRSVAASGAFLALAVAAIAQDQATSPSRAVIVLDASGSMWAAVQDDEDTSTRIEVARRVVGDLVDGLPEGAELGLVAYGHRRKGDCTDIETVVELGQVDADEFRERVNALNPKGMTPLTDAIRHAAEHLRYAEEKATVILVTDGLETCAPDPCAAAAELEAAGVDFTVHVIGFGLSAEESAKVACIADLTGGRFVSASNAGELSEALGDVVTEPLPASGPWFGGPLFIENAQLMPTGRTTDAPKSAGPKDDFAFPADGTATDCQAICEADTECSAWQFEPPGSYFVEEPRCRLYPASAELELDFADPAEGWAGGLKPGALMLVRPLDEPAAE